MQLVPDGVERVRLGDGLSDVRARPGNGRDSTRCIIHSRRRIPRTFVLLESDPRTVRALAYDVVLNGTELGGGSIRISDPTLQRAHLSSARHRRGDGAKRDSDSCSRDFAPARRRTAGSPSASTASRCCLPGPPACAM